MNTIRDYFDLVKSVWNTEVLGSDVGTWITALFIILFFVFIRGIFTAKVLKTLSNLASKTKTSLDDHIFDALEKPLSLVPISIGLFIATLFLEPEGRLAEIVYDLERSLIALVIFWTAYNAVEPLSTSFGRLETVFSKPMLVWLRKGLKLFFICIGFAATLEIWGIEVAPIIAGLGLFGVAVALGAQDMFKNLIAGMTIIAEKRFHPGDWICIDGLVEGTVEDIGFRSTLVRRFDKAPVHVPNAKLADHVVTNFSAMTHRRIYWKIGVTYDTTVKQLRKIRDQIEAYIVNSDDFAPPEDVSTFVRIDSFNDSSIDIMIYCFTKTTDWGEWLEIKESFAYEIKNIVEKVGSGFAFPSTSIYVEAMPEASPAQFQ